MNSSRDSDSKSRILKFFQGKMEKQQWTVILLLGVLLSVIALPVSKKSNTVQQRLLLEDEPQSMVEMQSSLELKLQNILECMEGAG